MTPEEMCRSCRHEAYCMAAYQKDHWCGNHTGKEGIGCRSIKKEWKYIKFNREHKALLKQLQEFPMGKNDDAPDGLQMAVQTAQNVKGAAIKTSYKSIIRRRFRMGKGAY